MSAQTCGCCCDVDSPRPRVFTGVLLILVGAVFLLQNLGLVDIDDIGHLWPVVLIVVGLFKMISPRLAGSRFWGFVMTLAGGWFLAWELRLTDWEPWEAWPVLLVLLGVKAIWESLARPARGTATDG